MTEPVDLPYVGPEDESTGASQLGLLLGAATSLVEEQFKIGDRLEAKSRNQVAVAATFFAGVQAGVIALLNGVLAGSARAHASSYRTSLAVAACAAVVALLVAVVMSYRAWRLRPEKAISTKTIRDYIPYAREGRFGVGANLVWAYTKVVEARQEQNAARAVSLRRAGWACLATLAVAGVELMLAFAAVVAR